MNDCKFAATIAKIHEEIQVYGRYAQAARQAAAGSHAFCVPDNLLLLFWPPPTDAIAFIKMDCLGQTKI